MSLRQSGINPLAYLGVEPVTVAADVSYPRDPTSNDSQNFQIMTRWLNTTNMTYWVLVSLAKNVATWIELAASGVGSVLTITGDAGGPISPDGSGNINFSGAPNLPNSGAVFTGNPATHDFLLSFNLFNMQNATSGGEGIYYYNNTAFISNFGTNNVFLGANAGNVTLSTAAGNIGIGLISLDALTTGQDNVCVGNLGQSALTTGSNNTSIGFGTLFSLISGSNNIAVGFNAGINYVAAESSNILIGNTGTAAESNVIRIGTSGQQNTAFMAGIYNVTPSGSPIPVVINSNGQLGTGEVNPAGTCAFSAYLNIAQIGWITATTTKTVPYDTTLFNIGSAFNTGTSTFTAPATGYYSFFIECALSTLSANTLNGFALTLVTTTNTYEGHLVNPFAIAATNVAENFAVNQSFFVFMNSGDTAVVKIFLATAGTADLPGNNSGAFFPNTFSGYRII